MLINTTHIESRHCTRRFVGRSFGKVDILGVEWRTILKHFVLELVTLETVLAESRQMLEWSNGYICTFVFCTLSSKRSALPFWCLVIGGDWPIQFCSAGICMRELSMC